MVKNVTSFNCFNETVLYWQKQLPVVCLQLLIMAIRPLSNVLPNKEEKLKVLININIVALWVRSFNDLGITSVQTIKNLRNSQTREMYKTEYSILWNKQLQSDSGLINQPYWSQFSPILINLLTLNGLSANQYHGQTLKHSIPYTAHL